MEWLHTIGMENGEALCLSIFKSIVSVFHYKEVSQYERT